MRNAVVWLRFSSVSVSSAAVTGPTGAISCALISAA
jgi:hypothetical protein